MSHIGSGTAVMREFFLCLTQNSKYVPKVMFSASVSRRVKVSVRVTVWVKVMLSGDPGITSQY